MEIGKRVFIVMLLLFARLLPVRASSEEAVIDPGRRCTLRIMYMDGSDGTEPIAGSTFDCWKVAGITTDAMRLESVYVPCVRKADGTLLDIGGDTAAEEIRATVEDAYRRKEVPGGAHYTGVTSGAGVALIRDMEQGVYLVAETGSVRFHLPSASFLISLPQAEEGRWVYTPEAWPKPVATGELRVKKKVSGSGGDVSAAFHFTVRLERDGKYPWKRSDGAAGTLGSGGELTLKSGEYAVISDIPAGTAYEIREKEANQDGYRLTATGASGRIQGLRETEAVFTNHRDRQKATPTPTPTAAKNKTQAVRTGDDGHVFAYVCMMAAAVVFFAAVRYREGGEK